MVEAGRMKEKDVVMLCISARQISTIDCPFFCPCGMDKSRSIIKRVLAGSMNSRALGEPCPAEICGNRKCLSVHLTERGVLDTGVQH